MINGKGILLDTADGCYGQVYDHLGTLERVNELLINTRVVFITHIHGDHQLGVLKILSEREKAGATDSIFVVTPTPMLEWMQLFINDSLENPELVHLVPSNDLNPEQSYFY